MNKENRFLENLNRFSNLIEIDLIRLKDQLSVLESDIKMFKKEFETDEEK